MLPKVARLPAAIRSALRDDRFLAGIIGLYVLTVIAVGITFGRQPIVGFLSYLEKAISFALVFPFVSLAIERMRDMRAGVPMSMDAYRSVLRRVADKWLNRSTLTRFLVVLVSLVLFKAAFSGYKQMLYLVNPYTWDVPFAEWDRALHGGRDAWTLVYPLLHSEIASSIIDKVYFGLWGMTLISVVVWQAWQPASRKRTHFLLAYVLCWIVIGTVFATLLSSGGPTYYTELTGQASPYAAHKEYLRSLALPQGLATPRIQDGLWYIYTNHLAAPAAGITAMPSMHVAMAELYAIVGRRTSRLWGVLGTLFSLTILVGSVYLLPHYAIDGYLSIILVHILWRLIGRFLVPIAHKDPPSASAATSGAS
jgi:hypothetical protein